MKKLIPAFFVFVMVLLWGCAAPHDVHLLIKTFAIDTSVSTYYSINPDGTDKTLVSIPGGTEGIVGAWLSPSGNKIIVLKSQSFGSSNPMMSSFTLMTMNVDGSDPIVWVEDVAGGVFCAYYYYNANFSSDDRYFQFIRPEGTSCAYTDLLLSPADQNNPTVIYHNEAGKFQSRFTSDGRSILVVQQNDLFLIPRSGGEPVVLYNDDLGLYLDLINIIGSKVYFASYPDLENENLFALDLRSKQTTLLYEGARMDVYAISRDQASLITIRERPDEVDPSLECALSDYSYVVSRLDASSGDITDITCNQNGFASISYTDDGKYLFIGETIINVFSSDGKLVFESQTGTWGQFLPGSHDYIYWVKDDTNGYCLHKRNLDTGVEEVYTLSCFSIETRIIPMIADLKGGY